jgi:hypothetical protein
LEGLANPSLAIMNKLKVQNLLSDAEKIPDSNARYVYSNILRWTPGQKLKGCFVDGTDAERKYVVETATELLEGKSVNISFDFGSNTAFRSCSDHNELSDVRVSFSDGCCAAHIGRMAHHPDVKDGPTVFIQGVIKLESRKSRQVIMHELIHTLGFDHEHQSPSIKCESEFNKSAVLKAYHWSEDDFKTNLAQLDKDSHYYKWSTYDSLSIMRYFFKPSFFVKGVSSPCYSAENYVPSTLDYEGLREVYPITGPALSEEATRDVLDGSAGFGVSHDLRALALSLRPTSGVDPK